MNEILLETMDDRQVSFVGELQSQTEGKVEFADGMNRSFTLKLYTIESGGFVPWIEYASDVSGEQAGCIAEIVDEFKDIENFFFVFVPDDLLEKTNGLTRDEADARKKLLARLRKTYESLTFAFLDVLQEKFGPTDVESAEIGKPESPKS